MTVETIVQAVCAACEVSPAILQGRTRVRPAVRARQLAALVLRERTGASYPRIARALGRDHTSVIAAVRTARRLIIEDDTFAAHHAAVDRYLAGLPPLPPLPKLPRRRRRTAKVKPAPAAAKEPEIYHRPEDTPETREQRTAFARRDRRYLEALQREHPEMAR